MNSYMFYDFSVKRKHKHNEKILEILSFWGEYDVSILDSFLAILCYIRQANVTFYAHGTQLPH